MTALYRTLIFACLFLAFSAMPTRAADSAISSTELEHALAERTQRVPEFELIREEAKKLGVRAWLFGGTAAAYGHYVNWDLQREKGIKPYQPERFDYDYTNIYRSNQDLDIVIDGSPEQAAQLQNFLQKKYPHLQGGKGNAWEVRLLNHDMGDKLAILGNPNFVNQHSDSNSTGMVEITETPKGDSPVKDVLDWKAPQENREPQFLRDLREGKIHYYFSPKHTETKFFKEGRNPPILSVIRYLTKAFQFELEMRPEDLAHVKKIIDEFDPNGKDLKNGYVRNWLLNKDNGRKLIQNAVNIEYASDTLENLGLRQKLMAIEKNWDSPGSLAWWMNKEPLRSRTVGTGTGKTARQLGLDIVAHETNTFLAYESITKSPLGLPNVLISRQNVEGEAAAFGGGFYSRMGRTGARGTGITIRFRVNPAAREGTDFTVHGDYVVFKNRNAVEVIQESLNWDLEHYFAFTLGKGAIDLNDKAQFEKLNRRIEHQDLARAPGEVENSLKSALESVVAEHKEIDPKSLKAILKKYPQGLPVVRQWMLSLDQARYLKSAEWKDVKQFLINNDKGLSRISQMAKINPGVNCALHFAALNGAVGNRGFQAGLGIAYLSALGYGAYEVQQGNPDYEMLKKQAAETERAFTAAQSPQEMLNALLNSEIAPDLKREHKDHTGEHGEVPTYGGFLGKLKEMAAAALPRFLAGHPDGSQLAEYSRWIEGTENQRALVKAMLATNHTVLDISDLIKPHAESKKNGETEKEWTALLPDFFRQHPAPYQINLIQMNGFDFQKRAVEEGLKKATLASEVLPLFYQKYLNTSTPEIEKNWNDQKAWLRQKWVDYLPKFKTLHASAADLKTARDYVAKDEEVIPLAMAQASDPAEVFEALSHFPNADAEARKRLAELKTKVPGLVLENAKLIVSPGFALAVEIGLRQAETPEEFIAATRPRTSDAQFAASLLPFFDHEIDHFFSMNPTVEQVLALYPALGASNIWRKYADRAAGLAKDSEELSSLLKTPTSFRDNTAYEAEKGLWDANADHFKKMTVSEAQFLKILTDKKIDAYNTTALAALTQAALAQTKTPEEMIRILQAASQALPDSADRSALNFLVSPKFFDLDPSPKDLKLYEAVMNARWEYMQTQEMVRKAKSWAEALSVVKNKLDGEHNYSHIDQALALIQPPFNPHFAEWGKPSYADLYAINDLKNHADTETNYAAVVRAEINFATTADEILAALREPSYGSLNVRSVTESAVNSAVDKFLGTHPNQKQLLEFRSLVLGSDAWIKTTDYCVNQANDAAAAQPCLIPPGKIGVEEEANWNESAIYKALVNGVKSLHARGIDMKYLDEAMLTDFLSHPDFPYQTYGKYLAATTVDAKNAEDFLRLLAPKDLESAAVRTRQIHNYYLARAWTTVADAFASTHPNADQIARFRAMMHGEDPYAEDAKRIVTEALAKHPAP